MRGHFAEDLVGKRYGRLTVVSRAPNRGKHAMWNCVCDCGTTCVVYGTNLRTGKSQSCGCYRQERAYECNTDHGGTGTRLFNIWQSMKERCHNPNCKSYANYGGRGIAVVGEWRYSFPNFRHWAHKNGYKEDLTIDRKDNDGPYAPWNCRWIPLREQQHNKSTNRYIEHGGERMTLTEWAAHMHMEPKTLHQRLRNGWTVERALTEPVHGLKGKRK